MLDRITVIMPAEVAADVERAIEGGQYISADDIVVEALQDWRSKIARRAQALSVLRADIQLGLDDMAAGRLLEFDVDGINDRGRRRSAATRASSD